jgi:hypothetical protein
MSTALRTLQNLALVMTAALLAPSAALAEETVTTTARYQNQSDTSTATGEFNPKLMEFEAITGAEAFGPEDTFEPSSAFAVGFARRGTSAVGSTGTSVDLFAEESYSNLPADQRAVSASAEARVRARFLVQDASPGGSTVPVNLNFLFAGFMDTFTERAGVTTGQINVRAEGRVSVWRNGQPVGRHEGNAAVDEAAGSSDGGDWDGLIEEMDPKFPEDGYILVVRESLPFNAAVGDEIEVEMSNRLSAYHFDAGGTYSTGNFFGDEGSEDGYGSAFTLESSDPGVTFIVVPEPAATGFGLLIAPLLLGRRRRRFDAITTAAA